MTDSSAITKPMIIRIWWAQTWRRYPLIAGIGALIYIIILNGGFYTKQCFEGHCNYNIHEIVLLVVIMGLTTISMITHWITLNRTYPQLTVNGSHFATSVVLKKDNSFAGKARAMLKFCWAYNWRYIPASLILLILASFISNYLSGFQKPFYASPDEESVAITTWILSDLIAIINVPIIDFICSYFVMRILLSKQFKHFEICITPHQQEASPAESL